MIGSSKECSTTGLEFTIKPLIEEIKPVITDEEEFESRDESTLLAPLDFSDNQDSDA